VTSQPQCFDFFELQETLADWPLYSEALDPDVKTFHPIYERIRQILYKSIHESVAPNFSDLGALLRHALIRNQNRDFSSEISVPKLSDWIESSDWNKFGFDSYETSGKIFISPHPWTPSWLNFDGERGKDIFSDVFSEVLVRKKSEVPLDPFLKETSIYESYFCPGQRAAVRSLLLMKPGTTLIVNLPTGAGKTLVAQTPVIMDGLNKGLTLFIVPTTALAMDQERRMKDLLAHKLDRSKLSPMAWHGALSKVDQQIIRENIRQGCQGILFTSPESAIGALLPALYDANRLGLLKYLIFDEAHLLDQWGEGFRPEFQALAGVRRGLLRECDKYGAVPFKTVLMSATISPQNTQTIDVLFSPAEDVQMVSSIHLRPEPRYLAFKARNENEKREKILELVRYVPRPFLLYVTEPKEARYWLKKLRDEGGYSRVVCFHGKTPNNDREEIIANWTENRLDGIVATSAFGVGMDKANVRTVIHATATESLERLYQEVGRAGRDGCASVSISIYTNDDFEAARSLSNKITLGSENAFGRWKTMFHNRVIGDDENLFFIDLTLVPEWLQQQSKYNRQLNLITLLLMARTGFIELDSLPPLKIEQNQEEDDHRFEIRREKLWKEFYNSVPIRTLDPNHLREDYFKKLVGAEIQRGRRAANVSLSNLEEALTGQKEMSKCLCDIYKNDIPGRIVLVSPACRGCPAEPNKRSEEIIYQVPPGECIEVIKPIDISDWETDFSHLGHNAVVLYPTGLDSIDENIFLALKVLVARYGIREIAASEKLWDAEMKLQNLHKFSSDGFVFSTILEEEKNNYFSQKVPRVTIFMPWKQDPIYNNFVSQDRPLHVILAPDDIQGDYPHKPIIDTSPHTITVEDFLRVAVR
jgi:ATP-dependent DNA helicase RecQ